MHQYEMRLRCLEAAAKMAGSNPNVEQQARAFYEFVTEPGKAAPVIVETGTTIIDAKGQSKGQRK